VGTHAVLGAAGPIAFGIVAIFVSIPNSNVIYAVAGLGIFGAFTIYDFYRLRRKVPTALS
jgi:FtsH-binding integral membrane protein